MGALRAGPVRRAVALSRKSGRSQRRSEHALLQLQRSVGNQAVAELVQRQKTKRNPDFIPALALAPAGELYDGKCDAVLDGAAARKKWSRNPLGKETRIILECGPESFEFRTMRPWFDTRGPWGVETTDGGSAWVTSEVEKALDDISDDIDDSGSQFWDGYHTLKSTLKLDLTRFCRD